MPPDGLTTVAQLRSWWAKPAIRKRMRVAGMILLVAGVAWSLMALDLSWRDVSWGYLVFNMLVLTPFLLLIAAITFRVTAAAAGTQITMGRAMSTVAHANVAELLPIPGGAMVRGAALVDAGTGVGIATRLVLLTGLLTLGLALMLSSAALGVLHHVAWFWLSALSLSGVALVSWLLLRDAGPRGLFNMVALRLVTILVTIARLVTAFAALRQTISWLEGLLYSIAPTLGTAVGIFPAGLGVNEVIAAGLATLIAASPATAFLAVAVNTALGLIVGAVLVFAHAFRGSP